VVTGGRAAVVVGVVVIAAIAVVGLRSSGSRVADPPTARPPPSAPKLLAAPGFGAGLGEWRAFPGTYLIKGQLGDPSALFARFQRDPTVAAAPDAQAAAWAPSDHADRPADPSGRPLAY